MVLLWENSVKYPKKDREHGKVSFPQAVENAVKNYNRFKNSERLGHNIGKGKRKYWKNTVAKGKWGRNVFKKTK